MKSVVDDRGYNQGWAKSHATDVRSARRCAYILSRMEQPPRGRLLEIGCGTGLYSFLLAQGTELEVLGTDLCVPFIEEASASYQLPNLRYAVLDFTDAESVQGEQFDYIVGNGILHHLYYSLDMALANIRRLLKDGGRIVFLEPNLHNPYILSIFNIPYLRRKAKLEPDEMAFSKGFAEKALSRAGFRDVTVEYRDFLLPGVPELLIGPSIAVGAVVERLPVLKQLSQSIFITADR
jgi:2-polyprenyl-3-methyl-5-hydroxy-6-metoxy-1,4-benzoquinol methylase